MNTNYKNLKVWERSINLVNNLYKITKDYPNEEKFWLVSQIRRASVSISCNIAEWAWRNWNSEFRQFLYISKWSCLEIETLLIISKNQWFISEKIYKEISDELNEIIKMIQWLINSKI